MENLRLKQFLAALLALTLMLAQSCGGGGSTVAEIPEAPGGQLELELEQPALETDPGELQVPGEAGLSGGAGLIPQDVEELPLPRQVAQAGVDFASNRFIVFFEKTPLPGALAPYLGNGRDGMADAVRTTDNQPLVQHAFFRRVSVNLGDAYGLKLRSRVFFRELNFAVYEVDGVDDVAVLDAAMLRVLSENQGLVREVHYDYFMRALGPADPTILQDDTEFTAPPGAVKLSREELLKLTRSNPLGLKDAYAQQPLRQVSVAPNDPMHLNVDGPSGGTWANWRLGAVDGQAWNKTTGSLSVVVAVLDSGVRYTHQDLTGNAINPSTTAPYNAPGILTDVVNKDNTPLDDNGHGTNCAGCIGARGNNALGLAGINWNVSILPMKVLNASGSGSDSNVAEAIVLADYLGVEVINMSIGGPFPDRASQLACRQATDDGLLVIAAAGNENRSAPSYPGYFPEVLCVGATTLVNSGNNEDFSTSGGTIPIASRFDARATFSNYGDWVDIAAPGVRVRTTGNGSDSNYTASTQGTSFSCPYVAGCAALIWGYVDPGDKNGQKVRELLMSGSRPLTNFNNAASPTGFISNGNNGSVRFCDVNAALNLYDDPTWPFNPPTVTWDNPVNNATISGVIEIRLAVSGGEGAVRKVEFETPTRHLGTVLSPTGGFYRLNWDTAFEFNRNLPLIAKVYDDKGNIVTSTITVKPSNTHITPGYLMNFDGLANDANPAGWFELDGNAGSSGNTSWGADTSIGSAAAPSLHTSGSTLNYASGSADWMFPPVVDLTSHAAGSVNCNRRCQFGTVFDEAYLFATPDDQSFFLLRTFSGTGLSDWANVANSLSNWGGQEVRLIYIMMDGSGANNMGLYIDDFAITGTGGSPPTITINSPANGSTVSGLVTINITVSAGVDELRLTTVPPSLGTVTYSGFPSTFNISFDSRHSYNGGTLLSFVAVDTNDRTATAQLALTVNNPTRNPVWTESFESITTLGGTSGGNFDGDWFTWQGGADIWRISNESPRTGAKIAKFGPSTAGANYGNNNFDQLYGPVHNCSSATNAYLRLFHKLDLGTGDMAKIVLVRYDGLDDIETTLAEFRADTTPAGEWKEHIFNLTPFKSTPFRLNFIFTSNNDGNNGTGWFIDDYELVDANPVISNIVDPSGAPGKTVVVNGSGFGPVQGASTVSFQKVGGGTTNASVNTWSNTAISVVVPADALSGNVRVTVLGFQSNGVYFGVSLPPPVMGSPVQL